jgi:hypothetical protein
VVFFHVRAGSGSGTRTRTGPHARTGTGTRTGPHARTGTGTGTRTRTHPRANPRTDTPYAVSILFHEPHQGFVGGLVQRLIGKFVHDDGNTDCDTSTNNTIYTSQSTS